MKKSVLLTVQIVIGLALAIGLIRLMDARQAGTPVQFAEDPLYVKAATAKRMSLAFNGLAADWYWMRSLQYVGRKIVNFEDTHDASVNFSSISDLDLRLLPSLLRVCTTLDPQFIPPYEYGAAVLPEINSDYAIALLESGVAANPSEWRLYQHLGYVYWQRHEYEKASEVYAAGARIPGVPAWMAALSARMKAEGGSRDAAREIYRLLYDSSTDRRVRDLVTNQIMRLDSLDQIEALRKILAGYNEKNGRCAASWLDVRNELRNSRFQIDAMTNAPQDPSDTPYRLTEKGCNVDLSQYTKVPRR
jgi:tetratricopeptide (TPR) repeat protein